MTSETPIRALFVRREPLLFVRCMFVLCLITTLGCGGDKKKSEPSPDAAVPQRDAAVAPMDASSLPDATAPREDASVEAGTTDAGRDAALDPPDAMVEPPLDCDNLPEGPVPYKVVKGPQAAEDFAFDKYGNLWSVDSSGNLTTTAASEEPKLRIPGVASGFVSGTRLIPSGDLIINDSSSVTRFSPTGGKTVLATGLSYPNGMAIGEDGWAYVAEQEGNRVVRIHPTTKKKQLVAKGIKYANGLSFSPDYKRLYVGGFGTGKIMVVDVLGDGMWSQPVVFAEDIGNGSLDGMGVDACGNVYVAEYVAAVLWRISPDGQTKTAMADMSKHTGWIPNMNWGGGEGWDRGILYVSDRSENQVYAVEVGVPGKKEPHLP